MKHRSHYFAMAAAAFGLLGQAALAQDSGPEYKFSGFGTLGLVSTDNDNAQFRTGLRQDRGADKSADFGVDSRLGLQLNAKFNSTFSGVAQVVTSHVDGTDKPRVEWLYGQAAVAPWLDVRLGRMVMPAFMVSDTLNVGYAMHWVRPSTEVYGQYPISSFDGGQLAFHTQWGNTNASAQVSLGQAEGHIYTAGLDYKFSSSSLLGLNLQLENGSWLFRVGQVQAPDTELSNPFRPTKFDDVFTGVGLQYDNGDLLVMSEYVTRRSDKGAAASGRLDLDSVYVSAGYRFGAWMPYVALSQLKANNPSGYLLTSDTRRTSAVGVRWDIYKNVAIKAQYESAEPSMQFVNAKPSLAALPTVNALSLTVDFVF